MTLPKIAHVTYTCNIPNTNLKYKYRPFVMREEKSMLNAKAVGDNNTILNTIESVVNSALLDKNVNAADIPNFIVDYLYTNMYIVSKTDRLPVNYTCNQEIKVKKVSDKEETTIENELNLNFSDNIKTKLAKKEENENEEVEVENTTLEDLKDILIDEQKEENDNVDVEYTICGHTTQNYLDLSSVEIIYPDNKDELQKIKINEYNYILLKYPSNSEMREYQNMQEYDYEKDDFKYTEEEREESSKNLIFSIIDCVQEIDKNDKDSIIERYPNKDFNVDEFFEWLESLPSSVSLDISNFLANLPFTRIKMTARCSNVDCLHKEEIEFIGAKSFLDLS